MNENLEKRVRASSKEPQKRGLFKKFLLATAVPGLMLSGYAAGVFQERFFSESRDALVSTNEFLSYKVDSLQEENSLLQQMHLNRIVIPRSTKQRTINVAVQKPPLAIDSVVIPHGQYFVEVDKPHQVVRVWQKTNYQLVAQTDCSTGLNVGEKSRQGDNKSPTGYMSIVQAQNSSSWLYGGKPAYGPYFFRLNDGYWNGKGDHFPQRKSSIGIHGTNEPERLGSEASHGCIRLHNNFVREGKSKGYLGVGVPVFIVPYNDSSLRASKAGVGYERIQSISGRNRYYSGK